MACAIEEMNASARRAADIFGDALERLDPPARAACLDAACAGDAALRREVEELLRAQDAAGDTFLQEPAPGVVPVSEVFSGEASGADNAGGVQAATAGQRIDRYVLVERLGEGGFGEVWLADQEKPVRRRVALKIIKLGMDTRKVVARFEAERQALALMDHPNIAKVLDGGIAESGRTYFVMEMVHGSPITAFCDEHRLSTRERLELLIQVCLAVQHAHHKGIVHRDLKPANVLVREQDGRAVPKVIDFGVAKVIEAPLTEGALATQLHELIGTPCYMSPEQAGLGNLDIDTRSDIYTLGVLLYELLAGHTPFDPGDLAHAGFDEMRRAIRERQPMRPSTRLQTLPRSVQVAVARRRQIEPPRLIDLLHGDLDWIVMKCLEKDRDRRYATANGLAADIGRHLNHEPILARPPSRLYRFRKMVRRNLLPFILVNAIAAALAIGLGVSLWLLGREREANRHALDAEREQSRLRAAAEANEKRAEENLWQAKFAQARAIRLGGDAGRRFECLAALAQAAVIRPALELRNEAVAALALDDLRPGRSFPLPGGFARVAAASPDFAFYALSDDSGAIRVRAWADEREVTTLLGFGHRSVFLRFSPDGRFLAAKHDVNRRGVRDVARVWDVERRVIALSLTNGLLATALDFRIDRPAVAIGGADGTIRLHDLSTGRPMLSIGAGLQPHSLRFSPDGARLAVASWARDAVLIFKVATGTLSRTLPAGCNPHSIAWHPDGHTLAVGKANWRIDLWDLDQAGPGATLRGHRAPVVRVEFSRDGELLASAGWDSTLRLWDGLTGEPLLTAAGKFGDLQFDAASQRLAWAAGDEEILTFELLRNRAVTALVRQTNSPVRGATFCLDGRILAVAAHDRISFWNVAQRTEAAHLLGAAARIKCAEDGRNALFGDGEGITGLALVPDDSGAVLRVGPPRRWPGVTNVEDFALVPNTRGVLVTDPEGASMIETGNPAPQRTFSGHPQAGCLAVSPNARWLATGTHIGRDVVIWDVTNGNRVATLSVAGAANVEFSPDGRWLVTGSRGQYALWAVDGWQAAHRFAASPEFSVGLMAFSPDSRVLAHRASAHAVRLVNPETGRELADLAGEQPWPLCFSPDGALLVVAETSGAIRIWNLRHLRDELVKLKLDWDRPPYPPAPDAPPLPPLRIEVMAE